MKIHFDRTTQSIATYGPKSLQLLLNGWTIGLAGTIGLLAIAGSLSLGEVARAEGSRELVAGGGNRPYTEWRTNSSGGLLRRTLLNVAAKQGEIINLGSSGVGITNGKGDIVVFAPGVNVSSPVGTTPTLLNCGNTGIGRMSSTTQETMGPLIGTNGGYTPCQFLVPSDGIYQVAFYGPDGPTGSADASIGATDLTTPNLGLTQNSAVSMWDITVWDNLTSKTPQSGRVFTDVIALLMGANNRQLNSDLYVYTKDGYKYKAALNGLDPNGFIFFANDKGILFSDGTPSYHSGISPNGDNAVPTLAGGMTLAPPVHKLFFNPPSTDSINALAFSSSFATSPVAPTTPTNFKFTATTGSGTGYQTRENAGGTFSFSLPAGQTYQIVINTTNNFDISNPLLPQPIYDPQNGDRLLNGISAGGATTVTWDGKDGNGNTVLALPNNVVYSARIIARGGEYHFPMIDAENNPSGLTITRLNLTGTAPDGGTPTTVYFDESDYKTPSGAQVTLGCTSAVLPLCRGTGGVDSSGGTHIFTGNGQNGYGDKKIIDTWAYYSSTPVSTPLIILKTPHIISGTVFNDPNGDALQTTNASIPANNEPSLYTGLYAVLSDASGKMIQYQPIADGLTAAADGTTPAAGTYRFFGVTIPAAGSPYTISVTSTNPRPTPASPSPIGLTTPTPTLPTGYVSTGENKKGVVDLINKNTITVSASDFSAIAGPPAGTEAAKNNLGFERLPTPIGATAPSQPNPTGTNSVSVPINLFNTSTDPDGTVDKYRITALPSTATSITVTQGSVTTTYTNSNFPATGLTVLAAELSTLKVDPVDGTVDVKIPFRAIDNAGKESTLSADAIVPFTASVVTSPPELILLKRITKINGITTGKKTDGTSIDLTLVVAQPDNATTPRDESSDATNPNWTANYPKGAIDGGVIKSGELVEYTIYFLSAGGKPVTNANFCDWVPKNTTFVPDAYGLGKGIQLAIGSIVNTLTNLPDSDRGVFYNPGATPPANYPDGSTYKLNCMTPMGVEGAVVVNLVNNALTAPENQLTNATASGTPGNSYGFVRFVSKVK